MRWAASLVIGVFAVAVYATSQAQSTSKVQPTPTPEVLQKIQNSLRYKPGTQWRLAAKPKDKQLQYDFTVLSSPAFGDIQLDNMGNSVLTFYFKVKSGNRNGVAVQRVAYNDQPLNVFPQSLLIYIVDDPKVEVKLQAPFIPDDATSLRCSFLDNLLRGDSSPLEGGAFYGSQKQFESQDQLSLFRSISNDNCTLRPLSK